jgi:hypothetical protein
MSSSEQPAEKPHVIYFWNDPLELEPKAEEEADPLQLEQIDDDLEIKQEIVLDPNE